MVTLVDALRFSKDVISQDLLKDRQLEAGGENRLYTRPRTTTCVSSYYYVCVLTLLHMSSYYYIYQVERID
jgi:hypothetical protein